MKGNLKLLMYALMGLLGVFTIVATCIILFTAAQGYFAIGKPVVGVIAMYCLTSFVWDIIIRIKVSFRKRCGGRSYE